MTAKGLVNPGDQPFLFCAGQAGTAKKSLCETANKIIDCVYYS